MPDLTAVIALDGTRFSENALNLVPFLREMGVRRLRLAGVWETKEHAARTAETLERAEGIVGAYLTDRAHHIETGGDEPLTVEPSFRVGRAADQIIAEEVDSRTDLLVMATHGRAGTERWRLGSVADEVIRRAAVPVLLAGPHMSRNLRHYRSHRIMVPLDGTPLAEQALPAALTISASTGAEISLVRVVTVTASWADTFENDLESILRDLEASAQAQIGALAAKYGCSSTVLRAGFSANIPNELIRYIGDNAIDLVVMTSHTSPVVERWLLGSVADAMLRGPAPVLLVKPGEKHTSRLLRPANEVTP